MKVLDGMLENLSQLNNVLMAILSDEVENAFVKCFPMASSQSNMMTFSPSLGF